MEPRTRLVDLANQFIDLMRAREKAEALVGKASESEREREKNNEQQQAK